MIDQHDRFRQDLAAYALGSLDPDDAAALERHLETCAECRAILDDYRQAAFVMPLALEITPPPPGAGDRLLARARAAGSPAEPQERQPVTGRFGTTEWMLLAAASLVLALILGGWLAWLQFDDEGDGAPGPTAGGRVVALDGSENAPKASGHLVVPPEGSWATLVATNLPAVDEGHAYQFWFVAPGGERVSGGVFRPDQEGGAVFEVDMPENVWTYERIGVTEEPAGGSPGPTGTNVLAGTMETSAR